jgi:hypothetical protein
MTKPIKNMYKTKEWSRFSLKSQRLPERGSQKLLKAATIARTAKILARILRGRIERKIDGVAGEDQFGFVRRKGIRDGIEMLGIISERNMDIDEELCACCTDWQNTIDEHQLY